MTTRFSMFTDDELDNMEEAFCNEGLTYLVDEIRRERRYGRKTDTVDKIRAEIETHCGLIKENHCRYCSYCNNVMGVREIVEIIDKYKAESE